MFLISVLVFTFISSLVGVSAWENLLDTVVIGVLIRNKQFTLPYFFHYLTNLNYTKSRIGIIIYEDHSFDRSSDQVHEWCTRNSENYVFVECLYNVSFGDGYSDELSTTNWSKKRSENVIFLRQKLLEESRRRWAHYLFMIDADVILTNSNVLASLIDVLKKKNALVISPQLNCTGLPFYANFWDEMSDEGHYVRSDRYLDMKERLVQGTFSVPLVHTAILFDLKNVNSKRLSFDRKIGQRHTNDDLLNFAFNCKDNNITLLLNNEQLYGYSPAPLSSGHDGYAKEKERFLYLKIWYLLYHNRENPSSLIGLDYLDNFQVDQSKIERVSVDRTFVINLIRRKNRHKIVDIMLKELNINFTFFPAVDGQDLSKDYLVNTGINQLRGYSDPFHNRGLTFGEIGCFLSHYSLWTVMIKENLSRVLILEDDIKINPDFISVVNELLVEADSLHPNWDFLYLGRKIMSPERELFVNGTRRLVIPNYSYRTTGYILNLSGARKFVEEKPLEKMLALDEFIPIMYGKSPHREWFQHFKGMNTVSALASHPKVIEPSHCKGDKEYVSDTEYTDVAFV